jgi:hypothetical protein
MEKHVVLTPEEREAYDAWMGPRVEALAEELVRRAQDNSTAPVGMSGTRLRVNRMYRRSG